MNDEYLRLNDQGLAEINPMASYNSQQAFIDNYRNLQAENTSQIGDQTHALGSDLEAPYGGLHGPSKYWISRYQTPQTESRLAGLRATNQAQALNQLMQNDLAREQEKYNQAARAAQQRYNAANSGSTTTSSDYDSKQGKVIMEALEDIGRAGTVEPGISTVYNTETGQLVEGTTVAPEGVDENGNARYVFYDASGNKIMDMDEIQAKADSAAQAEAIKQAAIDRVNEATYRKYGVSSYEELQEKLNKKTLWDYLTGNVY